MYNGTVNIYNHETALAKAFDASTVPVRCVRFIARKNWLVAGSDDFQLCVFNYNTHDKVASFEAHPDYIRCLAVHPTASIVLTGSDDVAIKAWDWDKQWKNIQVRTLFRVIPVNRLVSQVYGGCTHYVMNIGFNPKDTNTFTSACLDRTIKMWSISSPHANFTMDAYDKGVNYVDFYPVPDWPYLVTTGDDKRIKVWDYLSKSCVQTMEGHTNNFSFAAFRPNHPIIIGGSEDGPHVRVLPATHSLPLILSLVFPLIYHSISDEIPEPSRPLISRLYQLWLVLLATLVINMVACIFLLVAGSSDGGKDLGDSIRHVFYFRPHPYLTVSKLHLHHCTPLIPTLVLVWRPYSCPRPTLFFSHRPIYNGYKKVRPFRLCISAR